MANALKRLLLDYVRNRRGLICVDSLNTTIIQRIKLDFSRTEKSISILTAPYSEDIQSYYFIIEDLLSDGVLHGGKIIMTIALIGVISDLTDYYCDNIDHIIQLMRKAKIDDYMESHGGWETFWIDFLALDEKELEMKREKELETKHYVNGCIIL